MHSSGIAISTYDNSLEEVIDFISAAMYIICIFYFHIKIDFIALLTIQQEILLSSKKF